MTKLIVAFHNFANSPKTAVRKCSRQYIGMCYTQLRTAVVDEFAWLREAPVSFVMTYSTARPYVSGRLPLNGFT
jgi:hypothetical protein